MKSIWLLALVVGACAPDAAFHCASSDQCRDGDLVGACEGTGFCSFPDTHCDSGARYTAAGGALANECVAGLSLGNDRDHDGIVDALDNCVAIFNPGQENEDGDSYGDVCDPCPPLSDDFYVDSDGDGIDDNCDPHVGLTDYLTFEGFHHGLPTGWTSIGTGSGSGSGSVEVAGDSIDATPGATPLLLLAPYLDSAYATSVTITAGITPLALPANMTAAKAGVVATSNTTGSEIVVCELAQSATTMAQTFVADDTSTGGPTSSKPWAWAAGNQYSIGIMYDLAKAVSCHVALGVATTDTPLTLVTAPLADTRQLGIYVSGIPVSIDWVMFTTEH